MKTFVTLLAAAWLSSTPAFAVQECTRSLIGSGPELGPMVCQEVPASERGTTLAINEVPAVAQLYWQESQHQPPSVDPEQERISNTIRRWNVEAHRTLRARQDLRRQCPSCPR